MSKKVTKKINKKSHKKSQKKQLQRYDMKNIFFSVFFIIIGAIAFNPDTSSIAGNMTKIIFGDTLFGEYYKWIFSPVALLLGVLLFLKEGFDFTKGRFYGLFLYFISITSLIGWFFGLSGYNAFFNFSTLFETLLGREVTLISLIMTLLFSLYLLFQVSYKKILKKMISYSPDIETIKDTLSFSKNGAFEEEVNGKEEKKQSKLELKLQKELEEIQNLKQELLEEKEKIKKSHKESKQLELEDAPRNIKITQKESSLGEKIKQSFLKDTPQKIEIESKEKKSFIQPRYDSWKLPPLSLLADIGGEIEIDENLIYSKQQEIVEKLSQFKINVNMTGYRVGPTVTQFRLQPDDGVKLNRIVNLKDDLTLALHAKSLRIQAPIPGEGVVGVEVPNENRQAVGLKEVIESKEFNNPKLDIPISIGKDVSGNIVVGDLTKMPHLLVAGQTASGKSVGMNGFIISMLYKFSPSELKMLLIDPKMVELSIYNGIPHLLTPVITNPDKALNSLKWAVAEMLRRYDLAKAKNARNLKEYNEKVSKDEKLPYIVIIVDELADLMMSGNKKEVEGSIARIAQMARAVGMHLIVATQRPSVDVITGLIKANIPSRISFTVASQIDSRTIIDKAGAEDLLGRGDMLYAPTGVLEPARVQGVLVETREIENIVNEIKLTVDPDMLENLYDDTIINGKSSTAGSILEHYNGDQEEDPELIEKAIAVVRESKKGSTSLIQRKLGLGYARAAKILDILEDLGIVGPSNGSKPREVYD